DVPRDRAPEARARLTRAPPGRAGPGSRSTVLRAGCALLGRAGQVRSPSGVRARTVLPARGGESLAPGRWLLVLVTLGARPVPGPSSWAAPPDPHPRRSPSPLSDRIDTFVLSCPG